MEDKSLIFEGIPLSNKQVESICERLKEENGVNKLILRNTSLGDEEAKIIADSLKKNKNVEVVDLSYNNIGNVGASFLSTFLLFNDNLEKLNLSGNKITNKGGYKILEGLEYNNKISLINLNSNYIAEELLSHIYTVALDNVYYSDRAHARVVSCLLFDKYVRKKKICKTVELRVEPMLPDVNMHLLDGFLRKKDTSLSELGQMIPLCTQIEADLSLFPQFEAGRRKKAEAKKIVEECEKEKSVKELKVQLSNLQLKVKSLEGKKDLTDETVLCEREKQEIWTSNTC